MSYTPEQKAGNEHNTDVERTSSDASSSINGKQAGVLTAEASKQVAGTMLWVLIIGVGLTAYVAGLDNNTTYAYQQQASKVFGKYNLCELFFCCSALQANKQTQ